MQKFINGQNVPLSVAVFLATDDYDYDEDPHTISATALIRPTRQIVLSARVPKTQTVEDITGRIPSSFGTAIHKGIEDAWINNYQTAMKDLGYPQRIIDRIVINPDPDKVGPSIIPIFLEQRFSRKIMGYTITGKPDFIGEGRLEDFKTTSTMAWTQRNKDEDYILQGSIYRWLRPDVITSSDMSIQFFFTDWNALNAKTQQGYPSSRMLPRSFELLTLSQTEQYIRTKLSQIKKYWNAHEKEIPRCTDKELWRSDPEYKYYKNPAKMTRSTKNFTVKEFGSASAAQQAAYMRKSKDGNVGKVVEIPGQVRACKYCPAFPVCTQKDDLIADGSLKL